MMMATWIHGVRAGLLGALVSAGMAHGALAQSSGSISMVQEPVESVVEAVVADPFTVADVTVDVTAKNAVEGRELAFAEAQVKAFAQLAERLLPESQRAGFTPPDAGDVSTMINDFEVTQERLSAVRYVGTYTFRFNPAYVRKFLNIQGVSYTEMASKPVLVLPFYQVGSRTVLWQEPNPWLRAWARLDRTGGLVPVAVPMGDVRDVGSIGDSESLTYQPAKLADMLDRYGANEAIILIAAARADGGVDVLTYRTDRNYPEYVTTVNIAAEDSLTSDDVFDRAVSAVRETLQREWKAQTAVSVVQDVAQTISARVPFNTMQQWVETRNALRRVQGVANMQVRSVTPREARVELVFQGGEDRLRLALSQADLDLVSVPGAAGQGYELMLRKYRMGIQ